MSAPDVIAGFFLLKWYTDERVRGVRRECRERGARNILMFLHYFHPQPILFQLGPLAIHWYGFLMVVGGLLGYWIALKLARYYFPTRQLDNQITSLLIWFVVGAVIGARIYYVVYAWPTFQNNLPDMFKIWQGGLAVHGVMFGGFIATLIFCHVKKLKFWLVADIAAVALCAGQIVGRWGNYFNQEIIGQPTDLPWGIPIDFINRPAGYEQFAYFHPAFLYEVIGSIIILTILLLLHRARVKRGTWTNGNIFLTYLVLYSTMRFCLEFVRIDYSPLVYGVRWAMIFSIMVIVGALTVILINYWRNKTGLNRAIQDRL
ncbi:MAG: prolipoprotein diacylglyceryl transferase [Parcubacteria group bacterium]